MPLSAAEVRDMERHLSTGTLKPHWFAIHYEPEYLPNRPVRARLHQHTGPLRPVSPLTGQTPNDPQEEALETASSPAETQWQGEPRLVRSISMPTVLDKATHRDQPIQRRKSSLVSDCTHSRGNSVSEEGDCQRHHHRRGSVAIKFDECKVVGV